jgi:hypothetical protein
MPPWCSSSASNSVAAIAERSVETELHHIGALRPGELIQASI